MVRVAQNEKQLAFPAELELAWSFIQKHLDITSPSGNIVANIICNFDAQGSLTYRVNEGLSEAVLRTELAWCKLFTDSETLVSSLLSSALYKNSSLLIYHVQRVGHSHVLQHHPSHDELRTRRQNVHSRVHRGRF